MECSLLLLHDLPRGMYKAGEATVDSQAEGMEELAVGELGCVGQ